MSTSCQIAIRTNGNRFTHVRVNFDGYPSRMLKALEKLTDEQILAAREIRFISDEGEIEAYADASSPREYFSIQKDECYTYYRGERGEWLYR